MSWARQHQRSAIQLPSTYCRTRNRPPLPHHVQNPAFVEAWPMHAYGKLKVPRKSSWYFRVKMDFLVHSQLLTSGLPNYVMRVPHKTEILQLIQTFICQGRMRAFFLDFVLITPMVQEKGLPYVSATPCSVHASPGIVEIPQSLHTGSPSIASFWFLWERCRH